MSDASLARCPDSRKSTGAWVIFCNGGAVAASSKKYSFVDLSSTSAELKALSFAAVAVSGMRILLDCIGRPCAAPTLLVNDCRSAIIVAENPGKLRTRMNHLPTSAFKVRECVKQALVDLCWAPTDLVAADVLTKNLGAAKFRRFQAFLLNLPATQPVRELVTKLITGFR